MDSEGILRVGSRLNKTPIDVAERNPIIIHGKHHVAKLIIRDVTSMNSRNTKDAITQKEQSEQQGFG